MSLVCGKSSRLAVTVWAIALGMIFMLAPSAIAAPPSTTQPTAKVSGGEIQGVVKDGITSFKGIPYAAPPIGDLRWKAPQPVVPWAGVRRADKFGPAPMQPPLLATLMGAPASEDCLYLNVWTGAKDPSERRPVMVWIYGGAFMLGATSDPTYDGTNFAKKGVVLVSIGYRVGPFGFLAHPELTAESGKGSGCYGIQDQIAGLKWVKENIAQFGGDPSRVTIFGESAGGESVSILTASPLARGLFHRAISESGGIMSPIKPAADKPGGLVPSLQFAEAQGKKFFADLGVADLRAARKLAASDIQKVKLEPCWPVADGETIVGDPYIRYQRGDFNDTPILVGTNSDDGGMFAPLLPSPEKFEKLVRATLGRGAELVLGVYPHSTQVEAARSNRDVIRESIFAWPTWAWARLQSEKGTGKAYLYYFDYGPAQPGNVGHAADLPYVFGNFTGWFNPGETPANRAMSNTLMSYWINFATTGDPNGPGLPQWPAFDTTASSTMIFRAKPEIKKTPNLEKIEAFDAYWAGIREQAH